MLRALPCVVAGKRALTRDTPRYPRSSTLQKKLGSGASITTLSAAPSQAVEEEKDEDEATKAMRKRWQASERELAKERAKCVEKDAELERLRSELRKRRGVGGGEEV